MHVILKQTNQWPQMATEATSTARAFVHGANFRLCLRKPASSMLLFPASEKLEFESVDIFG